MTRNMDKRVEIAWPILNEILRSEILEYLDICLADTAKLRELMRDGTYTPLGHFKEKEKPAFDSQCYLLERAQKNHEKAAAKAAAQSANPQKSVQTSANSRPQAKTSPQTHPQTKALALRMPDTLQGNDPSLIIRAIARVITWTKPR